MRKINKLIETWDKEAGSYSFGRDEQVDYLADCYHVSKCFGNIKEKSFLEVGCGSGQVSAFLALKGGIINLLDISKKSLEFARNYFEARRIPVKLYNQDAFNMKFLPGSFDYVWNSGVIEHFDDNDKVLMLRNMWKLVKPGGKLLVAAPSAHDFPFMIAKKILQIRKKWAFGFEDDLTIKRLKGLATRAGIKDFSVYAYNPVVGFWFFPYGREITNTLNLNQLRFHKQKTPFGHVVVICAKKPSSLR